MAKFASNFTDDSIVIVPLDTLKTYTAHRSTVNFEAIKAALNDPNTTTDEMVALMSPASAIVKATKNYNNIQVIDGVLFYQGEEVHNALAERILAVVREGLPIEAWARFAEKLYHNPAEYAREELYLWLTESDLAITPDGDFLAYKKVRDNYTDVRTGKFDNSVGATPSMPREDVNSDRARTCSAGLHFCSKEYLKHFTGERVMILKINPEHVVSIPNDYNNAKGRACQYTVVGEIKEEEIARKVWPAVSFEFTATTKPAVEFGTGFTAKVVELDDSGRVAKGAKVQEVAKPKTYYVKTDGSAVPERLNIKHFENGVKKHKSMAAWAKSLGVGASTVKGWKKAFLDQGATLDI